MTRIALIFADAPKVTADERERTRIETQNRGIDQANQSKQFPIHLITLNRDTTKEKGLPPKLGAGKPDVLNPRTFAVSPGRFYSKIRIADAITVVHKARLSPTAVCVMLVVRTILLEMR